MHKLISKVRYLLTSLLFVLSISVSSGGTAFALTNNQGQDNPSPSNNAPAGNNGTVKIDGTDITAGHDNDPHVSCTFNVEWFGFDTGTQTSVVTFDAQQPTGTANLLTDTVQFQGSGAGNTLDKSKSYDLTDALSTYTPEPQQGYHVKLTIATTGSQGNDTKSKVFWVTGCQPPQTDLCLNIDGIQTEVPAGLIRNEQGNCVAPPCEEACQPVDVCKNIEGVQATIPEGLVSDGEGNCVAPPCEEACQPVDVCKNIEGNQTQVPAGYVRDNEGNCVVEEVTPTNPTVTAQAVCADTNQSNGTVTVSVRNTNSSGSVTYTVQVAGVSKQVTVAAGQTANVTFTGLLAAQYNVFVTGDDDTSAQTSVTVTTCAVTPTPSGGGGEVLGETTSTPNTPVGRGGQVLAASTTQPELVNTGMNTLTSSLVALIVLVTSVVLYAYRPKANQI